MSENGGGADDATPINERMTNSDDGEKPTTTTSRIAFGSCHKSQKSATPPIWETILPPNGNGDQSSKLDAWLWLGDAMYPSHRDPVTKKKYYAPAPPSEVEAGLNDMKYNNATIGYKGFLERLNRHYSDSSTASVPIVTGVWDDHDFGGNDMGSKMPEKKSRQKIYRAFLRNENGDNKKYDKEDDPSLREGMYHRVDMEGGKIRILVLDTRWFREDHCIPSVAYKMPLGNGVACLTRWLTSGLLLHKYAWLWGKGGCENAKVLGDEQWEWLENELLLSGSSEGATKEPPELFVIISSIQVWSTNPVMEGWGHFPKEQERLWNLLRTHYNGSSKSTTSGTPAPVLFLSGDVHHAEISGQQGYYEVTSSGLTHHCGQHKLYGPVCEPILKTFSDHRPGVVSLQQTDGESEDTQSDDNDRGRYFIGLNYGILEIVDVGGKQQREVRAQIKNSTGHTVLEVTQPLGGHGSVPVLPPYDQIPHTMDGHLIPYAKGAGLLAMIGMMSLRLLLLKLR